MHKDILTPEQIELLPLVASFSQQFGLVGGTAIALHIGHRESVDFDLFSLEKFDNNAINRKVSASHIISATLVNQTGEYTFVIGQVKFTFLHYPFTIPFKETFEQNIRLPDLLTLSAMKAYALGMRAKWKDYVDLYFIFEKYFPMEEVITRAEQIFSNSFNQKIFRTQLSYFNDIDYSEEIIFRPGFETSQSAIKEKLTQWSLR